MKTDINYRSVSKVLGELLIVEGIVLAIPLLVEVLDREPSWPGFLIAILSALTLGYVMQLPNRGKPVTICRKEGFLLVSMSWVVFSLIGMIPFLMAIRPLGVADAFFETVSGFTTTGATTIADVEILSKGLLLWRSMTQWIGGLGIILFMLALLPQLNANGGIPMYNAETTGITHDKLHPRIRQTAATLWLVYIVLTLALAVLLWVGPMDFYDAVNHALTAISTGGFSTKNASLAYWNSGYLNIVLTVFMFVGGVNFGLLYAAARGNWRGLWRNDVFRCYAMIIGTAYLLLLGSLLIKGGSNGWSGLLIEPLFHLVSDITTTGFSLADYASWGPVSLFVTIMLMISGGCAGSTSGAMKVDRLVAFGRNTANQIRRAIYPRRVYNVRVNGSLVGDTDGGKLMAFIAIYFGLAALGTLLLSFYGIGFTDALFASLSCIGNNGLGYGLTGVEGGYHMLPDVSKWVMAFLMLAGRLELFSMMVLFIPDFWKR